MDFLVLGPGAMGCLFAARLKKAGYGVTLLDYRPQRADLINRQGIRVEGIKGDYTVQVPTVVGEISTTPGLVIVCVKANQTQKAAQDMKAWLRPETLVLTLQNGLGNLETLEETLGKGRVLGGVTAEGATVLGDGYIRHAGQGQTLIGPQGSSDGPVSEIASAFNAAGFETRGVENVTDLIWGKLVINVGINALTAITRLKNGQLPGIPGTKLVMQDAVEEAVAVAREKGIHLPYEDPIGRVLEVCRATAENVASMLQDILKQRVTEIGFINGAIVKEAKSLRIPTPVNHTLTCLVQAIEETYHERVAIS